MERNLVALDKTLLSVSMDQLDGHTLEGKKQRESNLELKATSAKQTHEALTSYAAKIFIENVIQSVSYSSERLLDPPDVTVTEPGEWWKVTNVSKNTQAANPRVCFVGQLFVYCSCMGPSKFGYPCRHIIHLNHGSPFIHGHCMFSMPQSCYHSLNILFSSFFFVPDRTISFKMAPIHSNCHSNIRTTD